MGKDWSSTTIRQCYDTGLGVWVWFSVTCGECFPPPKSSLLANSNQPPEGIFLGTKYSSSGVTNCKGDEQALPDLQSHHKPRAGEAAVSLSPEEAEQRLSNRGQAFKAKSREPGSRQQQKDGARRRMNASPTFFLSTRAAKGAQEPLKSASQSLKHLSFQGSVFCEII